MTGASRLWILLLLPAAMWATHLQTAYSLHATVCEEQSRLMLWLLTVVTLAVVAVCGKMSWTSWHVLPDPHSGGAAGGPEDDEPRWRGRARFMAVGAFIGSCLFALVIVGQTIPMFMLRPCD